MAYLNHNLPPFTCLIRDEYMYDHQKGHGDFSVAEVHSVASMEHKVPLFEALMENGVNSNFVNQIGWIDNSRIHIIKEFFVPSILFKQKRNNEAEILVAFIHDRSLSERLRMISKRNKNPPPERLYLREFEFKFEFRL